MYRPEYQCGINSFFTVLVWSSSLPPAGHQPLLARTEHRHRAGLCDSKQRLQKPRQIVIESQMQPSSFQGRSEDVFYLFMQSLKLVSDHGYASLQIKHMQKVPRGHKFFEIFWDSTETCYNSIY